jgi:cytochrome P450
MTDAATLDLPVLPAETGEFSVAPDRALSAARAIHPWLARFSQGYIVHGYDAAQDLVADQENLESGFGPVIDFYNLRGTMWARFMEEIIMAQSGEGHARLRRSIAAAFTPRLANAARPMMREVIDGLLDTWAPSGSFDLAEFASFYPISVMCRLLDVPVESIAGIKTALENQLLSVTLDPAAKPLFLEGWEQLWQFADELVERREASGSSNPDSLLDTLILAHRAGQLDAVELRFMVLTMIVGGYDTTKNQFSVTMKRLLDRPDLYRHCAKDYQLCGRVVDEAIRHTATVSPYRAAKRDFAYRDVRFRKGDTLVIALPLANRDPEVFPDALTFDPQRVNAKRHLGFGRGPHICVGQFIAKAMLQEAVHAVTGRLRNAREIGNAGWRPFLGAWGLTELQIEFDGNASAESGQPGELT